MAKITGKTFDHKEALKAYGARWNSVDKAWTIDDASADLIVAMKLPGVIVTKSANLPKSEPVSIVNEIKFTEKVQTASGSTNDVVIGDEQFVGKFNMNPRLYVGFSSLGEFVEYSENIGDLRYRDDEWSGGSFRNAINLARNGWSDGVELAYDAAEIIKGDQAEQKITRYSVAGGSVNVGRMLSGNPLHMRLRTRQPSTKVITLFVDVAASATVEAQTLIIRAAAIAALVDVLEHNGYSAEIVAVCLADHRNRTGRGYIVSTKVKTAGEPLNLSDIVFALGHPSFLRQLVFNTVRNEPIVSDMHTGFGVPRTAQLPEPAPGEYFIEKFNANVKGGDFKAKVRAIFKHIIPADFPVELTE